VRRAALKPNGAEEQVLPEREIQAEVENRTKFVYQEI